MIKKLGMAAALLLSTVILMGGDGCSDADVVSHNLSYEADQFKIQRRVVFFNGITDTYLMTIEGLCSLGNSDPAGKLSVTCKVGTDTYKKHFLGLSDNVSFFVEQLEPVKANEYRYKVLFKPSVIVPDFDAKLGF